MSHGHAIRSARRRLITLLAPLALASAAAAQTGPALPFARSGTDAADEAACETHVADAASLNAPDLLQRASACLAAGRSFEANFLLNAAYVRMAVDVTQMIPASSADAEIVMRFAPFMMYYSTGPGEGEILRDAGSRDRYFALIDGWSPRYDPGYTPGWNVRGMPDEAAYRAAIDEAKRGRRDYLAALARLLSDDAFYELYRRARQIEARHTDGEIEEEDSRLLADLERQMNERAGALGSSLHSADADRVSLEDVPFPPAVPAPDEEDGAGADESVVRHCAFSAEWQSAARDARVERVLITRSREWGTIWRADIAQPDRSVMRFTCTRSTTSSAPLDSGVERIPPLPEGTRQEE